MAKEEIIVNRVANSGLITLNLENYFPEKAILTFDLKDYLFKELILKEKDFRAALKEHDWEQYQNKVICIYCSNDAIIPIWAYMLVTVYASPFAETIFQGNQSSYIQAAIDNALNKEDWTAFEGKRIVIKGCSNKPVPEASYVDLTKRLQPYAQSIMFGEPCSTVPIFKRPRKLNKG